MSDILKTEEFLVNMGPQHPATHGVLRLLLTLNGEIVVRSVPHVGYLHRSTEKILENREYIQVIPYLDRMDYLAAMCNELPYVLAMEKLMNIEVPERAQTIRVIIFELNRIVSHVMWWGNFGLELGAFTPMLYGFREREEGLNLFESISGQRLTYNYMRIGGVARDLPEDFPQKAKNFLKIVKEKLKDYDDLITNNVIFQQRTKNIGIITPELAINYGLSGPMLRGSGIKWDVRKGDPYCGYEHYDFEIPAGEKGDVFDRYMVRYNEIIQSSRIVEQALEKLKAGDIMAKIPKKIAPPKGEIYFRVESPRGELGVYIVSDGGTKPYRFKVRAPSFCNLSISEEVMKNCFMADLPAIIGSIDFILGDVDR